MLGLSLIVVGVIALVAVAIVSLLLAFAWRVVVDTNKVHIVQSGKNTISFGLAEKDGVKRNVYYRIPSFIPIFGVSVTELPINIFKLTIKDYKAYDKDRVPFDLDVTAFFRISEPNVASARVGSFAELNDQLTQVVQGAIRKILSSHDINTIMTDRATFGDAFTQEVQGEIANWGVLPVKNLELMDIRDESGSKVIANIMAKKISHIEMESRIEVAKNTQASKEAEIAAGQAVMIREQEAAQLVGLRKAEQERTTGIAREKANQDIQEEAASTKAKEMNVLSVEVQRKAEIEASAAVVLAEQTRKTEVIRAEGNKTSTVLTAEADLESAKREAEGVQVRGLAEAAAKKANELAPIQAQIELAKEIGSNEGYQKYLVDLRKVDANKDVGIAQAAALEKADIKIIANNETATAGLNSVGDLFTASGGVKLASMVEAFASTENGQKLIDTVTGKNSKK